MNKLVAIQRTLCVFLLLVLCVSAAPRIYFHDLVATHKDNTGCGLEHKGRVMHVQGYHCHFDDLVVSSPFLPGSVHTVTSIGSYWKYYPVQKCQSCLLSYSPVTEGRGPPEA